MWHVQFLLILYILKYCKKIDIIQPMNGVLKKIIYFLLSIQEKTLSHRLDKTLRSSYKNKTTKTIISATEHMTLSAETVKNKDLVRKNVEDIVNGVKDDSAKLLDYVRSAGCTVVEIPNADKILKVIGEDLGFISELRGLKALYLNSCLGMRLSFKTKPMFILKQGPVEFLAVVYHFYRWYSMKMGLPGFDYDSQQKFKIYMKNINADTSALSMESLLALQEAVARDKEATEFCLEYSKRTKGAENAHKKILEDGGANI